MVRRYERVIATLLIWIAVLVAFTGLIERFSRPIINFQNNWYYFSPVVTGADADEANQAISAVQNTSNQISHQIQAFTEAEILKYTPVLLIVGAVLLIAACVCTFIIWRSIVLPEMQHVSDSMALGKLKQQMRQRSHENSETDENPHDYEAHPTSAHNGR